MSQQINIDAVETQVYSESGPNAKGVRLKDQFVELEQQRETGELGMWLFLATEFMFFGAFFAAYLIYRYWYPVAFEFGSQKMDRLLGTMNTAILLTSSLTMALAVNAAESRERRRTILLLLTTLGLGTAFLGTKCLEYYHKYTEHLIPFAGWTFKPSGLERTGMMEFFNLYFLMTGMHAVHMLIGGVMLLILTFQAYRNRLFDPGSVLMHNVGLYWHFVDLVWVFLFPFFYLVGSH